MMDLQRTRKRLMAVVMIATAVVSLGTFAGVSVSNVAGAELLGGNISLAGLPLTVFLVGAAVASLQISKLMARRGRRVGLTVGFLIGLLGCLIAAGGLSLKSFPTFIFGLGFFGVAFATTQLSRFAAADMTPASSRGKAMGMVTWMSVFGAVIAPNLIEDIQRWSSSLALPPLGALYLIGAARCLLAAGIVHLGLRPDPLEIAAVIEEENSDFVGAASKRPRPELLRLPQVQVALAAMIVGQVVMLLLMSMTAVHMRHLERDWRIVGLVISGHLLGMYAFSPLSGWLSDRLGRLKVIAGAAFFILVANTLAAAAPFSDTTLFIALLMLGLGWNMGMVSGSALLTDAVRPIERPTLQGFADLLQSGVSAVSSLASGFIFAAVGYSVLSVVGGALALIPLLVVWMLRSRTIEMAEVT